MTPLTCEEIKICQALNLIRFYPREFHDTLLEDIASFAGLEDRPQRLRWLVSAARQAMAAEGWSDQLRGLWCTSFKPADGVEADCSLPGHSPAAIEAENTVRSLAGPELKQLAAAKSEASDTGPSTLPDLTYFAQQKRLPREQSYELPDWLK